MHAQSAKMLPKHQTRRYASEPPTYQWRILSPELRLMILEQLADLEVQKRERASWPSVCWEWLQFFERRNFSSLTLISFSDIRLFSCFLSKRRKEMLQKVKLHIPLARYDCSRPETETEIKGNNKAFSSRLLALLNILSHWDVGESDGGLTLQVSAASPSDTEYLSGTLFRRRHDALDDKLRRPLSISGPPEPPLDLFAEFKRRTLGSLLQLETDFDPNNVLFQGLDVKYDALQVPVITEFIVNRDSHRSLSGSAIRKILPCLTNLRSITYEPISSLQVGIHDRIRQDLACQALLRNVTPTVRNLCLWKTEIEYAHEWSRPNSFIQDMNSKVTGRLSNRINTNSLDSAPIPTTKKHMAPAARDACRNLQSFSAAHVIDAEEYFRCFTTASLAQPDMPLWPNLTFISFKSPEVLSDEPENELFLAAGNAAAYIPKLKIMELWDFTATSVVIFRYEVREFSAYLLLETTIGLPLGDGVRKAWKSTAEAHTGGELGEVMTVLDVELVATAKSFCQRLRLKDLVANCFNLAVMRDDADAHRGY